MTPLPTPIRHAKRASFGESFRASFGERFAASFEASSAGAGGEERPSHTDEAAKEDVRAGPGTGVGI
jgi:hypothetical protein